MLQERERERDGVEQKLTSHHIFLLSHRICYIPNDQRLLETLSPLVATRKSRHRIEKLLSNPFMPSMPSIMKSSKLFKNCKHHRLPPQPLPDECLPVPTSRPNLRILHSFFGKVQDPPNLGPPGPHQCVWKMINHKTFTRKKLNSPETTQSRTNLERSFSMIWKLWGFEFGSTCNPDPPEPSSCWCSSLPRSPQNLYRQRPLNPTMQPSIFFQVQNLPVSGGKSSGLGRCCLYCLGRVTPRHARGLGQTSPIQILDLRPKSMTSLAGNCGCLHACYMKHL